MNPVLYLPATVAASAFDKAVAKDYPATENTTDEFIRSPILNQRGQPTGRYNQVPNPNFIPPSSSVSQAQAVLTNPNAPVDAKTQASQVIQQATAGKDTNVPQTNRPMLSQGLASPVLPQRPTAPTAPTYGGNVGAQMFARSQAAAAQGGPAMLAGMAQGYNEGMQTQYNADMNTYKAEQQKYEDGVARYNTAVQKQKEANKAHAQELLPFQTNRDKLARVKARLDVQGSNITGMDKEDFARFFDRFSNGDAETQRTMTRKLLTDIGVDYTLLKIAQTKGAISNKEMEIFQSPVPNMNSTEELWKKWLENQIAAMDAVMNNMTRIHNGEMTPISRDFSAEINSLISGGSSQQSNSQPAQSNQSPTIIKIDDIPDGAVKLIK